MVMFDILSPFGCASAPRQHAGFRSADTAGRKGERAYFKQRIYISQEVLVGKEIFIKGLKSFQPIEQFHSLA